jgi:hypothetical protein
MNILVISDSHGDSQCVKALLERYAPNGQVQMALHLGDNAGDLLRYESEYPSLVMQAVCGNCDYGYEPERMLTLGSRRLLLLHGHRQNVKFTVDTLAYYAQERGADICLYGHTHRAAQLERGLVLLFNPGSVTEPRGGGRPTYGLLTVPKRGAVDGKIMKL